MQFQHYDFTLLVKRNFFIYLKKLSVRSQILTKFDTLTFESFKDVTQLMYCWFWCGTFE